jgi:hypothetical protein
MKLVYAKDLKPGNRFKIGDNPLFPLLRVSLTQLLREKVEIVTENGEHFHLPQTDLVRVSN